MLERCCNPGNRYYSNYGGRGITVCQKWRESYLAFVEDMGQRPTGKTLERRDNNLGYSKENCYWATKTQQSRNKRNTHMITWQGETLPLVEWAERLGLKAGTLKVRILTYKMPREKAMTPGQLPRH